MSAGQIPMHSHPNHPLHMHKLPTSLLKSRTKRPGEDRRPLRRSQEMPRRAPAQRSPGQALGGPRKAQEKDPEGPGKTQDRPWKSPGQAQDRPHETISTQQHEMYKKHNVCACARALHEQRRQLQTIASPNDETPTDEMYGRNHARACARAWNTNKEDPSRRQ